ncbi:hypothetical protein BpHYR1_016000 [Brachionus plicatilis]|uniref:Uncharacterized protein n=1 Tax=Brachionus plicatilis TaxID=10195 RepID=A0A3M7RAE7_BRAPC|nr:hypothetical protein BpHYR1_016000 [Brachionus plicatilis]
MVESVYQITTSVGWMKSDLTDLFHGRIVNKIIKNIKSNREKRKKTENNLNITMPFCVCVFSCGKPAAFACWSIFLRRFFGIGWLACRWCRIVLSQRWVLAKAGLCSGSSSQQAMAILINCLGQSGSQYFLRNNSTLSPKSLVRGK